MPPIASVLISTYNQSEYLDLALFGYARQSNQDFEMIVCDDGSREDTRAVIERHQKSFPVPLHHVWQPDGGFRKSRVINLGVLHSQAPYLLFSDGDCVPAHDFVQRHLDVLGPNTFAAGGHTRLTQEVSAGITPDDISSGAFEDLETTASRRERRKIHFLNLYYLAIGKRRKPKFYGLNFSVDRASYFAANGLDQTFVNSPREDSDLRNRLRVAKVKPKSVWHTCSVFHLWHPVNTGRLGQESDNAHYRRKNLPVRSPLGLAELAAEEGLSLSTPQTA